MLKALWRDFIDGRIDSDKKVDSPTRKTYTIQDVSEKKTYLILLYTKVVKIETPFLTKTAKNPTLWGHNYLSI